MMYDDQMCAMHGLQRVHGGQKNPYALIVGLSEHFGVFIMGVDKKKSL